MKLINNKITTLITHSKFNSGKRKFSKLFLVGLFSLASMNLMNYNKIVQIYEKKRKFSKKWILSKFDL